MDSHSRRNLTFLVWFFTLVSATTIAMSTNAESWLAVVVLAASVVITGFIWNWGSLPMTSDSENSEKAKRRSRMERLLDDMSPTEIETLRDHLAERNADMIIDDDGELVRRR